MATVDLTELQGAVDWVSGSIVENEAFVCRQTGKIYWISGDGGRETDDLPGDVDDPDKFTPVPNKYELDIGVRLVFTFAKIHLPDQYNEVRSIFRRKGAYGRYKALLAKRNLLERWFSFSEEQTLDTLKQWCESEGFAVEWCDRSSA